MKFRYQITTMIGVIDTATNHHLIPNEQFVVLYDAPEKLNLLSPLTQAMLKRVARITYENSLLEADRLGELGMSDTVVDIMHIDTEYVKQIRHAKDAL